MVLVVLVSISDESTSNERSLRFSVYKRRVHVKETMVGVSQLTQDFYLLPNISFFYKI